MSKVSVWKLKQQLRAVYKQFKAGMISYDAYMKKTYKLKRRLERLIGKR